MNKSGFFNIPPAQFALISALLGISFTYLLDIDRQNALGNFLTNVGQSLMTAAAQAELQKDQ